MSLAPVVVLSDGHNLQWECAEDGCSSQGVGWGKMSAHLLDTKHEWFTVPQGGAEIP